MATLVPVFDLDGTLLDSDDALVAPFVALGIEELPPFGLVAREACDSVGVSIDDYVRLYDTEAAHPFPGATELVAQLDRWGVCSNKHQVSGHAELARLGWRPDVVLFTDAFDGPKRLGPVLERLGVRGEEVVFIGDTAHDRACARAEGARFALAGWNPRAVAEDGDLVLRSPMDLLTVLRDAG